MNGKNPDNCQLDLCEKKAIYHLIYSCINAHITETNICCLHLTLIQNLTRNKQFRCHTCPNPITTGQYKMINPKTTSITRWLNGNPAKQK